MSEYRRVYVPGGTYFFTVVTYQRRKIFHDPQACELLKVIWSKVIKNFPFTTNTFCLLPDHFHCVITLPQNDTNFSIRLREIKRLFSVSFHDEKNNSLNCSRQKRSEKNIWQRRFWEHLIRDREDFANHMDYIHFNPVKHNLVSCPHLWEYSSFHRWINEGAYSKDWYCNCSRTKQDTPYFGNRYHDFGE